MDITEASKRTNCPDERQDLMDDHLLHREDEEEVAEQNGEDTLTNDIEKDPPVKPKVRRPRTKAQQEAFKKAQLALKAKREKEKERKASAPKKARGRPAKKQQKPKKETRVIFEASESETSSSESEDQEVVYVQRRKKSRKLSKPKAPRDVYVTDSSEEEQEVTAPFGAPPEWFKFV